MTRKFASALTLLPALLLATPLMAQQVDVEDDVVDAQDMSVSGGELAEKLDGWEEDVPAEWLEAEGYVPTPRLTTGLVSTANEDASYAGMQILRNGGNSIDAALAVMLALTVVEPQSSGIGGGGFLLHGDAETGLLSTIDGRETAPVSATPERFLDAAGNPLPFRDAYPGGLSVGVPGNIALMAMAHQKWGSLPWADLFTPAIQLAEGGFTVNATLAKRLEDAAPLWDDYPKAREIFWIEDRPAREGEELTNAPLARTLQEVAAAGPTAFYSGRVADEIINAVRNAPVNRGDMTRIDLSAYRAKERASVCTEYRVYKVCGMGPPSSGATTVLQILEMLEPFNMAELGPDDATSWHLIGEAMQLAYADRAAYLGDSDFVDVPVEGLIDPEYMGERSKLISKTKSRQNYPAGEPPKSEPREMVDSGDDDGTTHFVTIDADGNVTSMTSTIEGPFGSQMMAGGFFLNNELTDFSFAPTDPANLDENGNALPVANAVAPGKRPLSSMSPTIVYDSLGNPILALGSAGGRRIIMHVAKSLIGVLDFGLPLEEAIALPNIYFSDDALLIERDAMDAETLEALTAFGQAVETADLPSKLNGAQWTEEKGWGGAADPRSEGLVLAE